LKHCVLLGVLPTYVIPIIDRVCAPLVHENAAAALIPQFFMLDAQRRENITPSFLTELHDLGARAAAWSFFIAAAQNPDIFCYVHVDLMPLGIRYLYDMDVMWGTRHNDWWLPEMALTSRASPRPRGALEVLRTSSATREAASLKHT
jgi:hypothetical protein